MSFMKTFKGKTFFVNEPERTKFNIEDIAHALSNLCRFGGHTRSFYSVAQHSVLVADIVGSLTNGNKSLELWGLMHDATEAYLIDLPTPIKHTLPDYSVRENALMDLIIKAFKLPAHLDKGQLPDVVKVADRIALVTEARQLMHGGVTDWSIEYKTVKPFATKIEIMGPQAAEALFLARWKALSGKKARKRASLRVAQ